MRFIGSEEGGVVALSRTSGPSLVDVFAAGDFPSDAASPSEGGDDGAEGGSKDGYNGT
jgi:hypothetical protein